MKHNLTKPCHECPYVGNIPGWVGGHKDPEEFVVRAKHDMPFPCHMKIDYTDPTWEVKVAEGRAEQCVGQLAFMNRMCKRSIEPGIANHQDIVGDTVDVLWPPDHLIAVHRAGPIKGSKLRDAARAKKKKANDR